MDPFSIFLSIVLGAFSVTMSVAGLVQGQQSMQMAQQQYTESMALSSKQLRESQAVSEEQYEKSVAQSNEQLDKSYSMARDTKYKMARYGSSRRMK